MDPLVLYRSLYSDIDLGLKVAALSSHAHLRPRHCKAKLLPNAAPGHCQQTLEQCLSQTLVECPESITSWMWEFHWEWCANTRRTLSSLSTVAENVYGEHSLGFISLLLKVCECVCMLVCQKACVTLLYIIFLSSSLSPAPSLDVIMFGLSWLASSLFVFPSVNCEYWKATEQVAGGGGGGSGSRRKCVMRLFPFFFIICCDFTFFLTGVRWLCNQVLFSLVIVSLGVKKLSSEFWPFKIWICFIVFMEN